MSHYNDLAFEAFRRTENVQRWCLRCFSQHSLPPTGVHECPSCGSRITEEGSSALGGLMQRLQSTAPAGAPPDAGEGSGSGAGGGAGSGTSGGDGGAGGVVPPANLLGLMQMLGGGGLGTAPGDAVADEDMEALMARLMDQFGGGGGAPPASKKAVEALRLIEVEDPADLPSEVGLRVDSVPGELVTVPAAFGPGVAAPGVSGRLVAACPDTAHPAIENAAQLTGSIAIMRRGGVAFAEKIRRAQAAGAKAVVMVQNCGVWPYTMTDSATHGDGIAIPAVMVDQTRGDRLLQLVAPESKSEKPACVGATLICKGSSTACVVCQEEYERDDAVLQMPCQHLFHRGCLMTWFNTRNSCPLCRLELPTDDAEYESKRHAQAAEDTILASMFV